MTVVGDKVVKTESLHLENNQIKHSKENGVSFCTCTTIQNYFGFVKSLTVPSFTFFITKSFCKNCDFA